MGSAIVEHPGGAAVRHLIDGYNLLHVVGLPSRVGPEGMERARRRLLDHLAEAFGAEAARVTVVFDATRVPRGWKQEDSHRGVRVVFAVGHDEADDLLEVLIREEHVPRQLVVVSNDLRVKAAGRRRGCAVVGCEAFLDGLERRAAGRGAPGQGGPARQAEPEDGKPSGTSPEETRLWLQAFADLARDPDVRELFDPHGFLDEEPRGR